MLDAFDDASQADGQISGSVALECPVLIFTFEQEQKRQTVYFKNNELKDTSGTFQANVLYKNRPTPNCENLLVDGYYWCPAFNCKCRCISASHFFAHWTTAHLSLEMDSAVKGVSKCMFCDEILPYKDHKQHIQMIHRDSVCKQD